VATSDGAAFRPLLDRLGRDIVDGTLAAGSSDTVDAIVARTGASRTVVREATRVLVSLGMLTAGRRVGLRVLARSDWDLLDPQLIRWRLESGDRGAQLHELRGLRLAIEPEAARMAAALRTGDEAAALAAAAEALADATESRDGDGFLEADRRFHGMVLALARNGMLARLGAVLDEALRERTPSSVIRWEHAPADVALHRSVAAAVAHGQGEAAAAAMRQIVDPTGEGTLEASDVPSTA